MTLKNGFSIRSATVEDIPAIREISIASWQDTYTTILSAEQFAYDLERDYSPKALQAQMEVQGHAFLLGFWEDEPVGFASYSQSQSLERATYLNKLYLLPQCKGKGFGKDLIAAVAQAALKKGNTVLELTVNRANPSAGFYLRQGFVVDREQDIEIGPGFWRNDYVMVKKLA